MKNEEAEENRLLDLNNPSQQQLPQNSAQQQPFSSSAPVFSEEFLRTYQELLFQKERVKKQKIIEKLQQGGVEYYPTQNYDQFEMNLMKSTQNLEAMTLKCYMGPFSTTINIYRTTLVNQMHSCECLYGNSGNVYFYELQGRLFAVKCMQINKNESSQITISKFILRAIRQYFFAKIASILKVGPQLIKYQEFDLIFYSNCIEFWMEQCTLIQDENQRYKYKKQLTRNLRILHEIYIVHCDIKVENIAYSPSFGKPVFIDFGNSKVLNQGPGFKYSTYFFGTLDYCSPEMQKLYVTKSKGLVDLYYNDAHCFSKIYLDGAAKSTCSAPIQNMMNFEDQSGWFATAKTEYFLYDNDLKKITAENTANNKNWESILLFFQSLLPNEDLRDFYHTHCYSEWSESYKFRKLYQIYKFNKQYHLTIPKENIKDIKVNLQPYNWNIHVFKTFFNRKIKFDQLDSHVEEQKGRTIRSRADLFDKFKYFSEKITLTNGSSILQTYIQFKAKKQGENVSIKDYLCYLNAKLEEYAKSQVYLPSLKIFKQILKKKALIQPSNHSQTLQIIEKFGRFKHLDLLPYLIQCKMLEYSFGSNRDANQSKETVNLQDYIKAISDNIKQVDQIVIKFDVGLLAFLLFQREEQLQTLKLLFEKIPQGLRRESRRKLMNLAKVKSLLSRQWYQQAKKEIFTNWSQMFYFQYLDVGHFFLFKIFHQTNSYNTTQQILQFIDTHIQEQIDASLCKQYFKQQRALYTWQSSADYFQQHFRPQQFTTLSKLNDFTKIFISMLRKEKQYFQSQKERQEREKTNSQNLKSILFFLQNVQVDKFQREKKLLFYQMSQQPAIQTCEKQELRQLKILSNRTLQLRLYFNQTHGSISDSHQIIQRITKQKQHLTFCHNFNILDHILKAIKLCKFDSQYKLQIQLYDKILAQRANAIQLQVTSFTFMFLLKYCFQLKNQKLFKQLLQTIIHYVDTNPTKSNINHYISCLRYMFADKFDQTQLVFITTTLSFRKTYWKYSYFALYIFQVLNKLVEVWNEEELQIQILKSIKYIPYLNAYCVRYVQNILYPLLFKLDLAKKQRHLSKQTQSKIESKMRQKLLRKARKNIVFCAELTKKSYWLNQICFSFQNEAKPYTNKDYILNSQKVLQFYMGKLQDSHRYFKCRRGTCTKAGSLGNSPQVNKFMREKLTQYHQNCRNRCIKAIKEEQRQQLFRFCIE